MPAVGAAPACLAAAPAARPATKVPWPRPSPAELPASEVMFTCARTRPAKSLLFASMPESTKAIDGVPAPLRPKLGRLGQRRSTPTAEVQSSLDVKSCPCWPFGFLFLIFVLFQ